MISATSPIQYTGHSKLLAEELETACDVPILVFSVAAHSVVDDPRLRSDDKTVVFSKADVIGKELLSAVSAMLD